MKIEQISIFSYSIPLTSPLVLKGKTLSHREGCLIRLADQKNNCGWGEVAPLPGFSLESLPEALEQLKSIIPELKQTHLDTDRIPDLYPSVRFGLEMAVLGLTETTEQKNVRPSPNGVPVNALLRSLEDVTPEQLADLIKNGYRTFKIKVGRSDTDSEIKRLVIIAKALPNNCRLRLDANRAWNYDDAIEFCRKIKKLPVEYIEEPLADPTRLAELASCQSIPLALDESLAEQIGESLIGQPGIKAIVLKSTLLGGIARTVELARMGQSHKMTVVISSSYESSIGITCLASLAATVGPKTAHGLDTIGAFKTDLISNRPVIKNGILMTNRQADLAIDMSQLTEVSTH